MSFYGTPLRHGKGVNKPFRSPLLKRDQNEVKNDGTPTSRKSSTSRIDQNSKLKSLGARTPIRSRGLASPLKPLQLKSSPKPLENETIQKPPECSSPAKRLKHGSPFKQLENSSPLRRIENNLSHRIPGYNLLVKSSECNSAQKPEENYSPDIRLPSSDSVPEAKGEKLFPKSNTLNTPPTPIIQRIKSPECQPVVVLQRISPELQKMTDISKKDLAELTKRISDKQQQIAELRAKISTTRKHNLEELVTSIGKWREAFVEALETLRISLIERNDRHFSTSDVLKLLSIPSNVVIFSEEENNYIFTKL